MKTAEDLANAVTRVLGRREDIPRSRLLRLLDVLYVASLNTEEGASTRVQVAYADPKTADRLPSGTLHDELRDSVGAGTDRWRCVRFARPLPLSPGIVTKLGRATDPRTSSLLAFHIEGELKLWGLADMQSDISQFEMHELQADARPDRPGRLQVHVEGVGHLVVFCGFERIAELRNGLLLGRPVDIFEYGPVRSLVRSLAKQIYAQMRPRLPSFSTGKQIEHTIIATLCRLFLRSDNFRHGGAFLFSGTATTEDVKVAHEISYTRLLEGIAGRVICSGNAAALTMLNLRLYEAGQAPPIHLWAEQSKRWRLAEEAKRELDGAIWFVSLLTRVDGLVILDTSLVVRGFGGVLMSADMPEGIPAFRTSSTQTKTDRMQPLRLDAFGTRHRSMAAYCARHPGSVGVVMSSDGGVRVFAREGRKLVMWDNVSLHQRPMSAKAARAGEQRARLALRQGLPSEDELPKGTPDLERAIEKEAGRLFRWGKRSAKEKKTAPAKVGPNGRDLLARAGQRSGE